MYSGSPDPRRPETFNHKMVKLPTGHTYHLVDQVPQTYKKTQWRGTCLLLHGFPDLWYGWRYQIVALTNAGFRCIVPSCLGYGESSKPDNLACYTFKALSTDLNHILDVEDVGDPVLVFGHDWGGALAWRFAAYHPRRVKAICAVSTPYPPAARPGTPWIDLQTLVDTKLPNFGYQIFFASDEAAAILESQLDRFIGAIFAPTSRSTVNAGGDTTSWTRGNTLRERLTEKKTTGQQREYELDDAERQYYVSTFRRHGLIHPLYYYRTRRLNYEDEVGSNLTVQFPSEIPAIFITGDKDAALPLSMSNNSAVFFADGRYSREVLAEADHWLLQRAGHREKVNDIIVKWAIKQTAHSKL